VGKKAAGWWRRGNPGAEVEPGPEMVDSDSGDCSSPASGGGDDSSSVDVEPGAKVAPTPPKGKTSFRRTSGDHLLKLADDLPSGDPPPQPSLATMKNVKSTSRRDLDLDLDSSFFEF
jgi:hypothetical protein